VAFTTLLEHENALPFSTFALILPKMTGVIAGLSTTDMVHDLLTDKEINNKHK